LCHVTLLAAGQHLVTVAVSISPFVDAVRRARHAVAVVGLAEVLVPHCRHRAGKQLTDAGPPCGPLSVVFVSAAAALVDVVRSAAAWGID